MAVYYTITCPHCKKWVESGKDRSSKYGSPFRKCQFCGNYFVDNNYIELATLTEEEIYKKSFAWGELFYMILGALFFCMGIGLLSANGFSFFSCIILIIGAVLFASALSAFKEWIGYNPREDGTIARRLQESEERLKDPHYVLALKKADIYVPRHYIDWAKNELYPEEKTRDQKNTPHEQSKNNPGTSRALIIGWMIMLGLPIIVGIIAIIASL